MRWPSLISWRWRFRCHGSNDASAQARGGTAAPASPRMAAPIDLTGQWVAVISEDWRWRMITPSKGDIVSIPLNLQGQHVAEAWDPARDEAAGEQCRAYGAPGLMRGPIRMRISWLDDKTLQVETDYGMQTRLLRFGERRGPAGTAQLAGCDRRRMDCAWRWPRQPEVRHAQDRDDEPPTGVPAEERRSLQRAGGVHGILGRAYAAERGQTAGRHERGRRPGLSPAPVPDGHPLQARTGHQQWDPTPCDARF